MTHVFEQAGLGTAPFRYIGSEIKVGPIDLPGGGQAGAPGQPMGTCQYCGTGIKECCWIEDANGKKFYVGNECVLKTADKGLIDPVKKALNKSRLEQRHAREAAKIAELEGWLADESVVTVLRSHPHPNVHQAARGLTAYDFAVYMVRVAGNKGKLEAHKLVKQAADGTLVTDLATTLEIRGIRDREEEQRRLGAERQAEINRQWEEKRQERLAGIEGEVLAVLKEQYQSDFIQSVSEIIERAGMTRLSPRQRQIVEDIYGKRFGRYNSKLYWEAIERLP